MQPINYMLDQPNMFQQTMGGFQTGLGLADRQNAQRAQAAMNADIARVMDKGDTVTAQDYAKLVMKYPQLSKESEKAWGMVSKEQQQNSISKMSDVYAALSSGSPETALDMLRQQSEAATNSGDDNAAKAADTMAKLIEMNPNTAKSAVAMRLASAMGPDKFSETFTKLESDRRSTNLEEADLTEKQAKAHKAAVGAKFAESTAVANLEKKGWDIWALQENADIARENSKIAALNASIAKERNDIRRADMEAKLVDMKRKRDDELNKKTAEVESARSNIDNMLNSLDQALQTDIDVVGRAAGPISSKMPTVRQSTADFEELIKTIGAQSFLAQIPNMTGLGALSDAEGAKLEASLKSFSLRQSPTRLRENIMEAQRLMTKARQNLAVKYGVPDTIPDTPAAEPTPEEIQDILSKYPPQ